MYLCIINIIKIPLLVLGLKMTIYAIKDGKVTPYILDKNFEQYLPVIPSEVSNAV